MAGEPTADMANGMDKVIEVLLEVCQHMDALDERIANIEGYHKDVMDWRGFREGFDKRAKEHKRGQMVEELRGKMSANPEMEGMVGKMHEMFKGDGYEYQDGYEYLVDMLDSAQSDFDKARAESGAEGGEPFNRDQYLNDYMGGIKEKMAAIAEAMKEKIPEAEAAKVEVAVPEEAAKEAAKEEPKARKIPRPRY